jgi:hypothetical protein
MNEVHQRICDVRISGIVLYLTRFQTYVIKKCRLAIYYTEFPLEKELKRCDCPTSQSSITSPLTRLNSLVLRVTIAVLVYVRYTRRGTACRAPTPCDITLYCI